MFLQGNLLKVGLEDHGQRYQGCYAAVFDGEEVVALAAHYWNGNVILEAPVTIDELGAVAQAAVAGSGRPVLGILGQSEQVHACRTALGLADRALSLESEEGLFSLELEALRLPPLLETGEAICRAPLASEIEMLVRWRMQYHVEALGATDPEAVAEQCRDEILALEVDACHWVLEVDGRPVAYSAFNTRIPSCVQVGGVWTDRALRGRGYARSVVAGTLLLAREQGAKQSVLFTENPAAERAYRSLGYERIGNYAIVFFAP